MSEGVLLRNAACVTWHPVRVEGADLRIRGDEVVERGTGLPARGEEAIDLDGRAVIPGMVCAHHHLYSSLARGMSPPSTSPQGFREVLERVWWRLDRALDLAMVEASALAGAVDAAACGTTTIIDHHASPSAIEGSLAAVGRGVAQVGLRGVLCYEATDRGGPDEARRGVEEQGRFEQDGRFRVLVGAHASFTLEPGTLQACVALAQELRTGIHIHVAEDPVDEEETRERYGEGVLARLGAAGAFGPKTVLAHAVCLSPEEVAEAARQGCWFVHNPRSNMNNSVGYAPVASFPPRAALGTDGIGADMFAEMRAAFLKARDAGKGVAPSRVLAMTQAGQELASLLYGRPFGTLAPGSVADLAILDCDPPVGLQGEDLAAHLLFEMEARQVSAVYACGRWVIRDGKSATLDTRLAMKRARAQARRLWQRLEP